MIFAHLFHFSLKNLTHFSLSFSGRCVYASSWLWHMETNSWMKPERSTTFLTGTLWLATKEFKDMAFKNNKNSGPGLHMTWDLEWTQWERKTCSRSSWGKQTTQQTYQACIFWKILFWIWEHSSKYDANQEMISERLILLLKGWTLLL